MEKVRYRPSEVAGSRLDRGLVVLVFLCILAYFAVFAITNIFGFTLFCDSDTYPDILVAKLMWEQKTLFPDGWVFGNQLYVIATPALAALFYGLTGSTNWAMILATETMSILILISFLWVLRAITREKLASLGCCLLLISSVIAPLGPYSANGQLFFLQASYYSCYLITLFVVYGDYIRAFQTTKLRPAALGLSIILSFAAGMQSLRQTVIMVLPLLACEIFLAFRRLICQEKLWDAELRNSLLRVSCYTAANAAGLVTVKWMNIPQIDIIGDLSPVPVGALFARLSQVMDSFLEISGLALIGNPEENPFFGFWALVQVGVCIVAAVIWLAHIKRPKTPLELCWLLSLIGMIGVSLASVLFNIVIRSIYLFLYYPLVAFSGLIILQKLPSVPKRIAVLLLCALSLGNLFQGYTPMMEIALENNSSIVGRAFRLARAYGYPSKAYVNEHNVDAQNMCDWAMEEGYEYVYGNWEVVPHVAVHSDGKITAGYWYPANNIYQPLPYINAQDIYGEEENSTALYIFSPKDEEQGLSAAEKLGVNLTKVAEFGVYRAYTSPVPLMRHEIP